MRGLVLGLMLGLAGAAEAGDSQWIDVTGHAVQLTTVDRDAARRRALADALFEAALAGGADVTGHTSMSESVITSDLLIVRPVGRVLEHRILSEDVNGSIWSVHIRARVGADEGGLCADRRQLQITAFAPQISVSPAAPAWAVPLADQVSQRLLDRLQATPAVSLVRITEETAPRTGPAEQDGFDYTALTREPGGKPIRLAPGDHGFSARIVLEPVAAGRHTALALDLQLNLFSGAGETRSQTFHSEVRLPGPTPFGQLADIARPTRLRMATDLTKGVDAAFARMLDSASCQPVAARLEVSGNRITAQVGRKHGLNAGSLAFTADADASVQMLEVVDLSKSTVTLRPLDPSLPISGFAGRPVRFVDTGA